MDSAPGAPLSRSRPWPPRSAYLHIPFCHRRCFYCDFPVVPLGDRADGDHSASIRSYLTLLESEIAAAGEGPPLSTVYLGGGTPSLLTPGQVGRLLGALDRRFGLAVLRLVGPRPRMLVLGFVAGTGFVSMWVSNTAIVCVTAPCTTYLAGANRELDIKVRAHLSVSASLPLLIF